MIRVNLKPRKRRTQLLNWNITRYCFRRTLEGVGDLYPALCQMARALGLSRKPVRDRPDTEHDRVMRGDPTKAPPQGVIQAGGTYRCYTCFCGRLLPCHVHPAKP